MKKLLLLIIFSIFSFTVANSQSNWKIGVNAGITVSDVYDSSSSIVNWFGVPIDLGDMYGGVSFNLGGDVAYLFDVSDVFSLGPLVGYSHFIEEGDWENFSFIPLAASGRFSFSDAIFIGTDLGYAIGVNDGNEGGFYYRPKLGYNFGKVALIASYSGIEVRGSTFGSVNLGIEIGF